MPGARARNPTNQGERELIADRQSDHDSCAIRCRWSLQQASSTLETLVDGEPSTYGGHCCSQAPSSNPGSPATPSFYFMDALLSWTLLPIII